jgi:branched-chain amino acid transport system ATP-binding protein
MSKRHNEIERPLLDIASIEAEFGKNRVLKGVSLQVNQGEVVALIGPNAAGKTTTLRTIMGLKSPISGQISFDGINITRMATSERTRRGLVLVPEGRQLFTDFTVRENLTMGAYQRQDRDLLDKDFERIFRLFPRLGERQNQRSGSMSGGEQQMVAIGRGLMANPRCLILDEPTLGLAPIVIDEIESALKLLAVNGLTILISEQNAAMALNVASRAYVLESGKISLSGHTDELRRTEEIQKSYLGA